jgi:hypothetical protein
MKKARIRGTEAGLQKGLCWLKTHHLPYRFTRSATTRRYWKGCVSFCVEIIAMGNELQIWLYLKMQRLRLFPLFATLFFLSCDAEPGLPTSSVSDVKLTSLSLSPSRVDFIPADAVKDTTVQVIVSILQASGSTEAFPTLIVVDSKSNDVVFEGPMTRNLANLTATQYVHTLRIETTTTTLSNYSVSVLMIENGQAISNKVIGRIRINGFSTGRPVMLFEQTPANVQIPLSGSQAFDLKAKVSHPNGNALIQTVNVIIRGANGVALSGSPFQLFDNGNTADNGDAAAGDSLYTRRFVISSSNNPDTYTLRYYAIDQFGASSDTLTATMRFVP